MNGLQIGLIGCGVWGRNILRDLCALGAEVIVVDPSPEARAFCEQSGAKVALSLGELPAVDGIVVATPASTHFEVIRQCLAWDCPIFTEKPFTLDLASAQTLAHEAPDRLFVMHVWRYHPGIEALRDAVREEAYGPVEWIRTTRTNWTSPRTDVDSVWTMLPHDVSIVLELLGDLPAPEVAFAEWHRNANEQQVPTGIVGVLGKGPTAIVETSTRYGDKRREVRVHCRDAVLELSGAESEALVLREFDHEEPTRPRTTKLPISQESALKRELQTFLLHIQGGPAPKSGMADALRITETVLELRRMAGIHAND